MSLADDIDQMFVQAKREVSSLYRKKKTPQQTLEAALSSYNATEIRDPKSMLGSDRYVVLAYLQLALTRSVSLKKFSKFCQAHFGYETKDDDDHNVSCWGIPVHVECSPLPGHRVKTPCVVNDKMYGSSALRSVTYVVWTMVSPEENLKKQNPITVHMHVDWAKLLWSWSVLHMLAVPLRENTASLTQVITAFNIIIHFLESRAGVTNVEAHLQLPWRQQT